MDDIDEIDELDNIIDKIVRSDIWDDIDEIQLEEPEEDGTKSFLKQYGMHVTGAGIVRFFGGFFVGSILMALYILFVRDNGVQATWAFFNLVFVQNFILFLVGNYNMFVNKLGHTKKTSIEQVIAPGILSLLSALLCFGLADKIYI